MELLSPAGNFDCLISAVRAGADAVYIGGAHFSARRGAKNFTDEEIKSAARLCHMHRVKLYVAVNILIKEHEMKDAAKYVEFLIKSGVDGIIIQDLGLLSVVRSLSSDVFINASTQMSIASADAVNVAKKLGVNRVVLARELSLDEIKKIRKNTDIELETFVHGALCMSWSGQCLISSIIGARSGNRGLCAQPCRLPYTLLKDKKAVSKTLFLLSLKDICLADKLSALAGNVDSLKIEGRMKSPEYTSSVTTLYKKAITGKITNDEIEKTLSFFSRGGSTDGYFDGRKFDKMMDYNTSGKISAEREDVAATKASDLSKRRPITMCLVAKEGKRLELSATSEAFSVKVFGDVTETAQKPFDAVRAKEQLAKLGDTAFALENIEIKTEGNPFVPVSKLNELRRRACSELKEQICLSYEKSVTPFLEKESTSVKKDTPKLVIEVSTREQLEAARSMGEFEILTSYELSKKVASDFVLCPAVKKEGDEDKISALKIMVQNLGQLSDNKELYSGERLNVTNSYSCECLASLGVKRITLSPELSAREIRQITRMTAQKTEVIAYGHLPLMVMENCVIKSQGMCQKNGGSFCLSDRMGEKFPIVCENCRNILLNSVPIYMADKGDDLLSLGVDAIRLKFTIEDEKTTKRIIKAYTEALSGNSQKCEFKKITRGHFYRGVE